MGYSENRAKAKELYEQMRALTDKPGIMTAADEQEFNRLEKEINIYQELTRLDSEIQELKTPTPVKKGFDLKNLTAYQRSRLEKLALCEFLKTGTVSKEVSPLMQPAAVRLAQQTTSTTAGGYTIPQGFVYDLEVALRDAGAMWENARIVKTSKGNSTGWGYTNDTDNKAYIIAENADNTTDADPVVFGQKLFTGYKYTSGLIQVPNELLQDSELFAQEFVGILSDRFFRASNEHFTTGDGSDKPTGVVTSAIHGRHTTAAGDISSDDLLELIYSVNTSYRRRGKLMMHSTTLKHLQNKSSEPDAEKPFWIPPYKAGEDPAGSIWGYSVVINDDMASFVGEATSADDNKKPILFGDFSKYIIRQARDLRIVRFDERYADMDQTAFAVFLRVDGDILNAGTDPIKYMRVSTT